MVLITTVFAPNPLGGRALFTKAIFEAVKDCSSGNFYLLEIEKICKPRSRLCLRGLYDYTLSYDRENVSIILDKIKASGENVIILDGSNLGYLAKKIRSELPSIKLITQCHNVEYAFFLDGFLTTKKLSYLFQAVIHYLREKNAARYSHQLRCLTQADSKKFLNLGAKCDIRVTPIFLPHHRIQRKSSQQTRPTPKLTPQILFVGSNFYGNLHGLHWYLENVHTHVRVTLSVIGINPQAIKRSLRELPGVKFLGFQESLNELYETADAVIAPVFFGGGMKTKVAEALSFGLRVIGTEHSLVGYENIHPSDCKLVKNAKEFVRALNEFIPDTHHDRRRRMEIFQRKYSVGMGTADFAQSIQFVENLPLSIVK